MDKLRRSPMGELEAVMERCGWFRKMLPCQITITPDKEVDDELAEALPDPE